MLKAFTLECVGTGLVVIGLRFPMSIPTFGDISFTVGLIIVSAVVCFQMGRLEGHREHAEEIIKAKLGRDHESE